MLAISFRRRRRISSSSKERRRNFGNTGRVFGKDLSRSPKTRVRREAELTIVFINGVVDPNPPSALQSLFRRSLPDYFHETPWFTAHLLEDEKMLGRHALFWQRFYHIFVAGNDATWRRGYRWTVNAAKHLRTLRRRYDRAEFIGSAAKK